MARHISKKIEQENKMTAGVYLSYFNKAITDGKHIYSIKVLFKWDPEETEKKKKERRSILDEI